MSKTIAIVLGVCFVALGAATLVVALATLDGYRVIVGVVLCLIGMATLFYAQTSGRNRSQ